MFVCVCVCVRVRVFLGQFESDWDTLWHKVAYRPRMGSKTIILNKGIFAELLPFFLPQESRSRKHSSPLLTSLILTKLARLHRSGASWRRTTQESCYSVLRSYSHRMRKNFKSADVFKKIKLVYFFNMQTRRREATVTQRSRGVAASLS